MTAARGGCSWSRPDGGLRHQHGSRRGVLTRDGTLDDVAARARHERGTGAASTGRYVVSAGGEATPGTIKEVYALDLDTNRWRRLDLPTPRHGLGVAYANGRVYVVAGGPTPGLSVSPANEFLPLR